VRKLRHIAIALMAVSALGFLLLGGAYQASQSVPDFYQEALQAPPQRADQAGDEFEQEVVALHNELRDSDTWELALTDQQVNGWLATDLPEKFPGLLPEEAEEPRVAFRDEAIFVACRIDSGKLRAVLSLKLQPYLTDQPNEIAVRVDQVRAGALPIPLSQVLEQVSVAAINSGIPLRWAQEGSDPVALVSLPMDHPDLRRGVVLEQLEVATGRFRVAGRADGSQSRVADSAGQYPNDQR
jgi:hypothetical protein